MKRYGHGSARTLSVTRGRRTVVPAPTRSRRTSSRGCGQETLHYRGDEKKWQLEREILRRAVAYSATRLSWKGAILEWCDGIQGGEVKTRRWGFIDAHRTEFFRAVAVLGAENLLIRVLPAPGTEEASTAYAATKAATVAEIRAIDPSTAAPTAHGCMPTSGPAGA